MLRCRFECLFTSILLPIHPEGKTCSDYGFERLFSMTLLRGAHQRLRRPRALPAQRQPLGGACQSLPDTPSTRIVNPRVLSQTLLYAVSSNICRANCKVHCVGRAAIVRHVIQHILRPRFLSQMASWPGRHCFRRHPTRTDTLFLESSGIL
jgi:hypothetical protein